MSTLVRIGSILAAASLLLAGELALGGDVARSSAAAERAKVDLRLKTDTQAEAFSTGQIRARAAVRGGARLKLKGSFRLRGSEERFRFGPLTKRVDGDGRNFRFQLTSKQREILAFAAERCARTPVKLVARTRSGARGAILRAELRRPPGC